MEAETLQSKLAEAYLRLEANIVYKLSSSEKKKREVLMGELSYEINYLSDVTPIETDCNPTAAPPQGTEHVDTDQLSTALQNIQVEHRDQKVTAIELTGKDSEHVEPTITEVENADETCRGYAIADTDHTVRVTEETAAHTKELDVHVEEHAHNTEEPDDQKEKHAAYIEKSDDHKVEPAGGYTKEHAAFRKERAAYIECTDQPPGARPTVKTCSSANSQSTVMQIQVMNEHACTDSNKAEDRDIDIKVWHHSQNTEETIKTPESMSIVATCCHSDYSNEICYLLLYS